MNRHTTLLGIAILTACFPVQAESIYWFDLLGLHRANLDGSDPQVLMPSLGKGLLLDVDAGKMYWIAQEDGSIKRANLDGTGVEPLAAPDLGTGIMDLAVDAAHGRLYWTVFDEGGKDRIRSAQLDGTGQQDILVAVDNVNNFFGLALDSVQGELYWAESYPSFGPAEGESRISHRPIGGGPRATLTTVDYGAPIAFSIDIAGDWLYWANAANDIFQGASVRRVRLEGTDADTLVDYPFETFKRADSVASDPLEAASYWTVAQGSEGFIMRASADGTNMAPVLATGSDPRGLALDLSIPGDANGDRAVNLDDFGILKAHFGAGSRRSQGDFNADHQVDLTDFGILKENFGGGAAVPEPSAWVLALLGIGASLCATLTRSASKGRVRRFGALAEHAAWPVKA